MEMRNSGGSANGTLLLVRFHDEAAANRRVAGMSAVGRWAARAREAGFGRVAIEVPDAAAWPPATRDDLRRIGLPGGIAAVEPGAPLPVDVRVVDGRFLVDATALRAGEAPLAGQIIDLDQPAQAARRIVRATAKPSDGIVSRRINRPVSQAITQALLAVAPNIRPSHMTLAVAAVAIVMVLALMTGSPSGLIWGGVLFQVASVLDGVDGEIARASYRSSQTGAVLDTRVDMLTNIGYFVGVSYALTRIYGGHQAIVGGTAVLFALTGLGVTAWLLKKLGRPGSFDVVKLYYRARFPGGWQKFVTDTLVAMTSRDFFAFALGVVIVLGFGWAVSWLLLGFTATYLFFVLCAVPGVLRTAPPVRGISA
ncbi:CDP-alcohol phosphatidyltransferase family protein [Sphingomonas sp.]|uniref:CDP-alcohol phosphatidyltransferase family protein n=1 Tax=Sphingomonas sp. TaxID=28214 RepID=UPI002D7E3B9E|nr:CDP-alcohol phosphatidyltransferase family protein [Sphingomonas sp.]HEU0045687.1 CDP-alcohol phosphatidyltransferase family protein [Sphingomonas sp.]